MFLLFMGISEHNARKRVLERILPKTHAKMYSIYALTATAEASFFFCISFFSLFPVCTSELSSLIKHLITAKIKYDRHINYLCYRKLQLVPSERPKQFQRYRYDMYWKSEFHFKTEKYIKTLQINYSKAA